MTFNVGDVLIDNDRGGRTWVITKTTSLELFLESNLEGNHSVWFSNRNNLTDDLNHGFIRAASYDEKRCAIQDQIAYIAAERRKMLELSEQLNKILITG